MYLIKFRVTWFITASRLALLITHKQMFILEDCTWLYQVVTHGDKAGFEVFSVHDSCSLLQDISQGKTKPGGEERNRKGSAVIARWSIKGSERVELRKKSTQSTMWMLQGEWEITEEQEDRGKKGQNRGVGMEVQGGKSAKGKKKEETS